MNSEGLAGTAEALEGVAGKLDDAADRHEGAHDQLETKIEELRENWESNDRMLVTGYGSALREAVKPIHAEGGLPTAAEALRELAGTAEGLAEELAAEEAIIESASNRVSTEVALSHEFTTETARENSQQRIQDAQRDQSAARARIEEIETRWWGACETCSGAINTAVYRVSTPQEVGIGQRSGRNGSNDTSILENYPDILLELGRYEDAEAGRIEFITDEDGNTHAVVTGSDESDYVEIIERDGQLYVHISQLNGDGELIGVQEHALPSYVDDLTIRTGDGNDVVSVPPGVAENIELNFNTGDGNNLVGYTNDEASILSVSGGDGINVVTGDGNNTIHGSQGDDRIVTGAGDHNISGVSGSNVISAMEDGRNQIHGGDEDDIIRTGDGNDYIDGGKGGDYIESTGGDNVLSAGESDGDHLVGGDGNDTFVFGRGETHATSTGGNDTAIRNQNRDDHSYDYTHSPGTSINTVHIEVNGRPGEDSVRLERPDGVSDAEWDAWVNRVESDMEMIRHTPSGKAGMEALDEDVGESGWFPWTRDPTIAVSPVIENDDGHQPLDVAHYMQTGRIGQSSYAGGGGDEVGYDTNGRMGQDGNHTSRTPDSVILFHEFAHSWDQNTGTIDDMRDVLYEEVILDADGNEVGSTELRSHVDPDRYYTPEINSVGYDQDGSGSIDDDETWGDHPTELTEHEIRDDLGIDPRTGYMTDPADVPEGGRVVVRPVEED